MRVTDDRLQEIAETAFEDIDEQGRAVRELAAALLDLRGAKQGKSDPGSDLRRAAAKPLGDKVAVPCKNCSALVVKFTSVRTGRAYFCDVARTPEGVQVSGTNWLHRCGEAC